MDVFLASNGAEVAHQGHVAAGLLVAMVDVAMRRGDDLMRHMDPIQWSMQSDVRRCLVAAPPAWYDTVRPVRDTWLVELYSLRNGWDVGWP